MEDNSLNISINAVDQASEVFASVGEEAQGLAESVASAAQEMNSSLGSITSEAENLGTSWSESAAELSAAMGEVDGAAATMAESFAAASAEAEASMNSLTEIMAMDSADITEAALAAGIGFDEAAAMIKNGQEGISTNSLLTSAALIALGQVAKQVGENLRGFFDNAFNAATTTDDAMARLQNATAAIIRQGQDLAQSDSAVSVVKKDIIDKIRAEEASIASLSTAVSGYNKTTAQLHAEEAQRAAQLQTHYDKLEQLRGSLIRFSNLEESAKGNADAFTATLAAQAEKNVALGFTYSDSIDSLAKLVNVTGSVSDTLLANQAAMDLARAKNEDLKTATTQVAQAYAGFGRGLQDVGIYIKDGLSGTQSLNAILENVGGTAKRTSETMGGSLRTVNAEWNKFMSDLGNSDTGILAPFLHHVAEVIAAVDRWATAHPRLTETLLVFVGVLGTILIVGGTILTFFALVSVAIAAVGGSVIAGFMLIAAGVAALVAIIVAKAGDFKTTIEAVFKALPAFFKTLWDDIVAIFKSALAAIEAIIDSVLSKIEKITGGIKAIGGTIAAGASSVVNTIADHLPHFAEGGIVSSPTIAMVGEAGPEAIIPLSLLGGRGAGGGLGTLAPINVYITGTVMSSEDQAKYFGDAIAKQIGRSLKLQSFR